MTLTETAKTMVVACDHRGRIASVVHNDLGVAGAVAGETLLSLVDSGSRTKLLDFMAALRRDTAAVDVEVVVATDQALIPVRLAGAITGEHLTVLAVESGFDTDRVLEGLTRMNIEQSIQLRSALKEVADARRLAATGGGEDPFDEMTRINNELSRLQRQLAKQNAELKALNAEKSRFLGFAAHDLRGPLAVMASYAEFVLEESASKIGGEQARLLERIVERSRSLALLVGDLLSLSAIESGRLVLEPSRLEIGPLIRRWTDIHEVLAAKKSVTIELDLHSAVPFVWADELRLEHIIANLLENAIKFSPPGASVTVVLRPAADGVRFEIRDMGPGISAEEKERLFKPFEKGRSRPTGNEPSTGLGLAIVHRIVTAHGGRIGVESEEGRGSTFWVELPSEPSRANGGERN